MITHLTPIAHEFAAKHNIDVIDVFALITEVIEKVTIDNYEPLEMPVVVTPDDWLSLLMKEIEDAQER